MHFGIEKGAPLVAVSQRGLATAPAMALCTTGGSMGLLRSHMKPSARLDDDDDDPPVRPALRTTTRRALAAAHDDEADQLVAQTMRGMLAQGDGVEVERTPRTHFLSSPQKTWTMDNVAAVTGSLKSPPGGLTAPMTVTVPSRVGEPRHSARPARS